jgi:hypothetical protein
MIILIKSVSVKKIIILLKIIVKIIIIIIKIIFNSCWKRKIWKTLKEDFNGTKLKYRYDKEVINNGFKKIFDKILDKYLKKLLK